MSMFILSGNPLSAKRVKSSGGFTIVELLIVIVVIAILAAISIVAYTGIQNKAHDSAVRSDLANIAKQINIYRTTEGNYPRGVADWTKIGPSVAKGSYDRGMFNGTNWFNLVYCWPNSADPDKFAIVARSKSGKVFAYQSGGVREASYGLQGSLVVCRNAGVDMDASSDRDWFYNNDAWGAYVN